ncbi:snaclec agglucetin subunit alpha-1 isoform X2 [Syngnathus scovelli]
MMSALGSLLFICGIIQLFLRPSAANIIHTQSDSRCPPGWVQLNNHCFFLKGDQLPFDEAEQSCKELGGNLASIHNRFEQAVVNEFTTLTLDATNVWIGLSVNSTGLMWTDGSETSFASFEFSGISTVGCYSITPDNFVWTVTGCDVDLPYVCVRDVFQCVSLCQTQIFNTMEKEEITLPQ